MRRWARTSAAVLVSCVLAAGLAQAQQGALVANVIAQNRTDVPPDWQGTLQRAEQGDADAQREMGSLYDVGERVPENYAEAMRWYRLAAEQGNSFAQGALGHMYYNGRGVPSDYIGDGVRQNYSEALRWFRLAAEQGDGFAQYSLGRMYYLGQGVPKDDAEAVRWFRHAAERNDADSQNYFGVMYYFGEGVLKDYAEAYKWFKLAANAGNEAANKNLALVMPRMTPAQLAEGERRWAAWRPTAMFD